MRKSGNWGWSELSSVNVHKSVLENILKTQSTINCEEIHFLAINDFNNGFSPVLKLQAEDIHVASFDVPNRKQSGQIYTVDGLKADYFNMILSEWEPLLEVHGYKKK